MSQLLIVAVPLDGDIIPTRQEISVVLPAPDQFKFIAAHSKYAIK
jgi:hypothetical protein